MKDLDKTIRRDALISRIIAADNEAYLVGGYIRDLLRGVVSRDIDFVVKGDMRRLISRVFPDAGVTVIEFKGAMTLRVVAGDYTIDFSELRGNLDDDLTLRDFTMNAIAWSSGEGLADPLGGAVDIKAKRIRGISEKNFIDDPLRLLRAYRFAGEFGWEIDGQTRRTLGRLSHLIKQSAAERITFEIIRLLNSRYYLSSLKMALKDGLLPELFSLGGRQLDLNIKALSRLDSFFRKTHEGAGVSPGRIVSQELTYIGLLRAEQLLCGSIMERNYLRLSRTIFKRLSMAGRLLEQYGKHPRMKKSEMFELFSGAGDAVMDIALLSRKPGFVAEAGRFLRMKAFLPAQTVMKITGLRPGPELGGTLKEMKKLQFLGKLRDKNGAAKWLRALPKTGIVISDS